jgi:hypothetical protein
MKISRYRWFMLALLLWVGGVTAQETPQAQAKANWGVLANTHAPQADREWLAQQFHPSAAALAPFPDEWQVGATTVFHIVDDITQQLIPISAELLAVGDHVYVWVEAGMPVQPASAESFAAAFDTQIYTPVIDLWQIMPPPGRIHTLFSAKLLDTIAGYFLNRDTLRAKVWQPDLLVFNLLASTINLDNPYTLTIAAHEFQHLLRYQAQPTTEAWIDEGFSVFTELYLGFSSNEKLIESFLEAPDTPLTLRDETAGTLAHYGAEALLITYFYQQFGLAGLRDLSAVSGGNYGAINRVIQGFSETDFRTFFADWVLANAIQQMDTGYGYTGVLNDADLPPIAATTVATLPSMTTRRLHQFAADYYEITPHGDNITITLDFAPLVPILAEQSPAENRFWYSRLADNVHAALTCEFDLTKVQTATLNYDVWFDLEDFWDYGYVFVSDDNATWTPLITQHGTAENPLARAYGWGYTGVSENWQSESISLAAYAGKKIQVQFAVITDDATLQPGMALDNVAIPEIDFLNTGDSSAENCSAAGWASVTNALPQQVLVLVVQHIGDDIRTKRRVMQQAGAFTVKLLPKVQGITLVIIPITPYTAQPLVYTLHLE